MLELTAQELDQVSGGDMQDANALAVGIFVGGCVGFLFGGPVGAVAGAIDGGLHAWAISAAMH
jgi:fructose-specific phosphotransferase system IIC component